MDFNDRLGGNMMDYNVVTIGTLKNVGTLRQVKLFDKLADNQKNMETLKKLDGYARPRVFKFLSKDLRTLDNFNELPEFDRWVAFEALCEEDRSMENLKKIPKKEQCYAFQFLHENQRSMENLKELPKEYWHYAFEFLKSDERNMTNLKKLPREYWHYAFKFLSETEKLAENLQQLPKSVREKSFFFLSELEKRKYNKIERKKRKRTMFLIKLIMGIIAVLIGIKLIVFYTFCLPVSVFIGTLIGLSATYCTGIVSAVGGFLIFGGIISSFLNLKKYMKVKKIQRLNEKILDSETNKQTNSDFEKNMQYAITKSEQFNQQQICELQIEENIK